jgi:3-oxoadipate enol-lactonase
MGAHVRAGTLDVWTERVGAGRDVLLIGGAGDTVESWQFQLDGLADRYRLIAFDNRGAPSTTGVPGARRCRTAR